MEGITALERARQSRKDRGGYIDLVNSDFGTAGIHFPERFYRETWERWRADPAYRPSGRGGAAARSAVARFLSGEGLHTRPEQIVLTAGSSISYSLLFQCLKQIHSHPAPGDGDGRGTVLLPRPGYPLFEELVHAAGLTPLWYPLDRANGFVPRRGTLEPLLRRSPLALVVISPNNPSGSVYGRAVLEDLLALCTESGTPLISDEVFSAFCSDREGVPSPLPRPAALLPHPGPLVFSLNGLSKLCAAPEIKLGWIAIHGAADEVQEAVERLDTWHDTLLTLSGFAEKAGEVFLSALAEEARRDLAHRVNGMRRRLGELLQHTEGLLLPEEDDTAAGAATGGIHRIVQLDANLCAHRFGTIDDEALAVHLLEEHGVYLHPGYLYGLDQSGAGGVDPSFIITCLQEPTCLEEGILRLRRALRG